MKVKSTNGSERGSALLEAAVTMLTLLVIVFAIFEAGRMLNIQQTLTNAAREGARLSVLPAAGTGGVPTDTLPSVGTVQARVQSFLSAAGINGATATVNVDQSYPAGAPAGAVYSRVTVTVPYKIVSISMFKLLQVNLQGQAKMRNETNTQ